MTRLVGLKMQGVRSIDEEAHVINFLDPLTIIQGSNGTGKTTIIESLNYITTGALPSGRLASFIHNNKLSKKKRVDALIQLKFIDFRGNQITATKRMCAAENRNSDKITTKSDEFTLKIQDPNGRIRSESAKVADFNRQIESLFGVPAAILEHVIFCHQEESTWPLGEPKELKTKFDAIFEVERFVKVMDGIKKSVKEFETELKVIQAELPHIERQMQSLGGLFMQLEENSRKIAETREFLKDKEGEKIELEKKIKELKREHDQVKDYEQQIELKQKEIEINRNTVSDLITSMDKDIYSANKENLIDELHSIKNSSEYSKTAAQKEDAQKQKKILEEKLPVLQEQKNDLQSKINEITSKQMMLETHISERETVISGAITSFRFKCQPDEFLSVINNEIKKAQEGLNTFLSGKEAQKSDLNKKMSSIHEKIVTFTNIDSMKRKECSNLKIQIQRLEKELSNSQNSNDSITKIQNAIFERSEKLIEIQKERVKAMDALKQKLFELDVFPNVSTEMSDIESLESRFAELALANSNSFKDFIRHSVGEKALLSENTRRDLVERKSQFDDAENEMKQAFQSIQPLRKEFQTAEEELTRFDKSVETERNLLSQRISRMEKVVEQIDDIDKKLRHIKEEIDSSNVNECHEKNEDCDKKIEQIREECNHLTMVMAECDNRNQVIRNLEDRIRVLNTKELVLKLEKEIEEIQANFSRPSKEIDADMKKYAAQLGRLSNEMNKQIGGKDILQQNDISLRKQLKGEQIHDVKNKLKQKITERVSIESAVQDLRNLAKVMDDSIIQYHTQKMEEINSILNDLWPRVYQGNDIETIQIRSQPTEGSDKRKSYDYSVIMIVDQIEIQMRERCSAGQKMLASLLIRVALAEVFGGNCPILALDEPTTNLDASKVENMGTILKDLLEACQVRENQHHLQLIVITHDKRLVEHLFTACRPEYVYGLSKDENGVSKIRVHRSIEDESSVSTSFAHPKSLVF